MKNLQNIRNVYFLGIGGIGMSALARYFKFTGRNVAGYDRTPTALTNAMQAEGIDVHFEDDIRKIPSNWDPASTLAVFTPALPEDHKELSWFREKPIGLLKRAKVLGLVCNERSGIAVSGTHGKTTVSTMVANILNKTYTGCGAFLGGISKNFGTNLLLPKVESPWIVVEADEFDRSFLHLTPQLALVTSIDADHLDIYGQKDKIVESFEKFISQIQPGGKLVIKKGVELNTSKTNATVYTYSLKGDSDFATVNLHLNSEGGFYQFDIKTPGGIIADCKMNYPGLLNVENAVAAASLAFLAGATENEIKTGLEDYQGVIRRFDVRFRNEKYIYIDDYAHHPEELKAIISSVKELYKGRKLTGIFQPHLYSRTRDFSAEFAASLDLLDTAILIPLYPAREEPIRGISSAIIFNQMKIQDKHLVTKPEMLEILKNDKCDIVLTMGAGDIDGLAGDITEILKKQGIMFRKVLKLIGLLFLMIFIVGTLAFTSIESRNIPCTDIEVVYDNEELINIDKDKLIRIVKNTDGKILKKTLGEINSEEIEDEIEKVPAILTADVYKLMVNEKGSYKGVLVVNVKHREPVMRVITSSGSYYLDKFGVRIPVSSSYATNVLVASGSVSEEFAVEKLLPFVLYVDDDDFWNAQIQQIFVEEDGDVLLIPLVGGHVIELGDTENFPQKLNIMRAFYKQVLAKNNWDKYERVSLKYNNQVVAKRR